LRNFNKQYLILAKFYIDSASAIGNQNAKFQLNLSAQTIVTAAYVRSPQNVKCPVLGYRLFNADSVHGLLGNSAINLLAPYPFLHLNSLIKTRSSAENTILLLFMFFRLRQQTSLCFSTSVCDAILVTKIFCYRYSTFDNFRKKSYFSTIFGNRSRNLLRIKCTQLYSNSFRFDIFIAQCLGGQFFYRTQLLCRDKWQTY